MSQNKMKNRLYYLYMLICSYFSLQVFRTLRKLAKNYIKHQTERNTSKKFLLKIQNEFLFAFPLILQHSKHL